MELNKVLIELNEKEHKNLKNFFMGTEQINPFFKQIICNDYVIKIYFERNTLNRKKEIKVRIFIFSNTKSYDQTDSLIVKSLDKLKYLCLNVNSEFLLITEIPEIPKRIIKSYEDILKSYTMFSHVNYIYVLFSITSFLNKEELLFFNRFMCVNFQGLVKDELLDIYIATLMSNKLYYYGYECLEFNIDLYEKLFKNTKIDKDKRACSLIIYYLEKLVNNDDKIDFNEFKIAKLFDIL